MAATAVGARVVAGRPMPVPSRQHSGSLGSGQSVPSYSEFDGIPISASKAILTDLLRSRMGFTGTTVSDYMGVAFRTCARRLPNPPEEAGGAALAAGMDVETPAAQEATGRR